MKGYAFLKATLFTVGLFYCGVIFASSGKSTPPKLNHALECLNVSILNSGIFHYGLKDAENLQPHYWSIVVAVLGVEYKIPENEVTELSRASLKKGQKRFDGIMLQKRSGESMQNTYNQITSEYINCIDFATSKKGVHKEMATAIKLYNIEQLNKDR